VNSLKTLLIGALLAALAYAVYVGITGQSRREPADDPAVAWQAPAVENPNDLVFGAPPVSNQVGHGSGSSSGPNASGDAAALHPYERSASAPPFGGHSGHAEHADGHHDRSSAAPPLEAHEVPHADAAAEAVEDTPPVDGAYAAPASDSRYVDYRSAEPSGYEPYPAEAVEAGSFSEALAEIQAQLNAGQISEAHYTLSQWYGDTRLSPVEGQQLMELLNGVAGTVVYSRQHLLEAPYIVRAGETLSQIAELHGVPWQLLARINGVRDPEALVAGEELKVIRGPFDALVRLDERELTLVIQGRYAGRFPIGVGREQPPVEGQYSVIAKDERPDYSSAGLLIRGGEPDNPLGGFRLDLGNNLSIHGTSDPTSLGRDDPRGCIRLDPRDIDDVYNILSVGSKVIIQR